MSLPTCARRHDTIQIPLKIVFIALTFQKLAIDPQSLLRPHIHWLIVAQASRLIVAQINWMIVAFWLLSEAPFGLVFDAPTNPKWIQNLCHGHIASSCLLDRMTLYRFSVEFSWKVVLSPSLLFHISNQLFSRNS
jgi:hypothetical protein